MAGLNATDILISIALVICLIFPIVCGWFLYRLNYQLEDIRWYLYMIFHDEHKELFEEDETNE